jgi:hypothetical protein
MTRPDLPGHEQPAGEWPERGLPDDDWPGPDWPDDDWPDDGGWPVGGSVPLLEDQSGQPHETHHRLLRMAIIAVVAGAAGAAIGLAVKDLAPAARSAPLAGGGQHAGIGAGGPAGQPPPGATGMLMLGGKVRAVSATSITIGAGPQTVTAQITSSTRVTGRVTSIAGVRVGDMVAAQISERNGTAAVVALQDPASLP